MSAQWYYDAGGRQAGPLDEAMLVELIRNRDVRPETLVWREGMANWTPCGQVPELSGHLPAARPPRVPPPAPAMPGFSPAPVAEPVGGSLAAPAAAGVRFCGHCGGQFDENDMIQYQGAYICAACKPAFFQKMREGVGTATVLNYAGFWIRVAAKFIDSLIIMAGMFVILIPFAMLLGALGGNAKDPAGSITFMFFTLLMYALIFGGVVFYMAFMHSRYGATLGKMAVGIRVITLDGRNPSFWRAFGRVFAEYLSSLCLYIGYIMAGFDEEKRALHDHICGTRVVYK